MDGRTVDEQFASELLDKVLEIAAAHAENGHPVDDGTIQSARARNLGSLFVGV